MPNASLLTGLLVVDDDSLLCELLTHLLEHTEFQLNTVSSGEAALRYLQSPAAAVDAILTDLQMPAQSGLELSSALRQAVPSALLLGMSARAPRVEEEAAFDAFLQKPFDVADLRDALQAAARKRARPPSVHTDENGHKHQPLAATSASIPDSELTLTSTSTLTRQPFPADFDGVLDPQILAKLQAVIGPAQLGQLYEMTASDVESRLEHMRQSLAAHDGAALRAEAHAIKGGCAMVGAMELSQLAAEAEGSSETGSDHLREMFEACIRLRRMITIVSP